MHPKEVKKEAQETQQKEVQKTQQPSSAAGCGNELIDILKEMVKVQTAFQEQSLKTQADTLAQLSALRGQWGASSARLAKLPEDCPRLPVDSLQEIRELNAYLENVEKLEKTAEYLRQLGGVDEKAAVRAILATLLTNDVAKQCSWQGSKGTKEPFRKQANILALILAALKPKFAAADKTTVAAVVKKWVYCSGDRDGGRTERRQKEGPSPQDTDAL